MKLKSGPLFYKSNRCQFCIPRQPLKPNQQSYLIFYNHIRQNFQSTKLLQLPFNFVLLPKTTQTHHHIRRNCLTTNYTYNCAPKNPNKTSRSYITIISRNLLCEYLKLCNKNPTFPFYSFEGFKPLHYFRDLL